MPTHTNITRKTPEAIQIWGFHGACSKRDVVAAVKAIAAELNGANNTIHIMSGTHGYCTGTVGAVATPDERFANEDREIKPPASKDNNTVAVMVHDFNNGGLSSPDPVTAAMAKLNQDMRALVQDASKTHTFLLAYCCSGGTN